jgi:chromosome segregation ATPase
MTEPNDERLGELKKWLTINIQERVANLSLTKHEAGIVRDLLAVLDEVASLRGENERLRGAVEQLTHENDYYQGRANELHAEWFEIRDRAENAEAEVERLRGLLEAERLGRARCLLQFSEVEAERDALKEELSGNDAAHRLALAELAALRDEAARARPLLEAVQDCPIEALDERCGVMKGTYTGAILRAAMSYRQAKGEKK